MAVSTRRTLGMIGVALTCPCHAIPLLVLAGGSVGAAWRAQYMGGAITVLVVAFLCSLWLWLTPRAGASAGHERPEPVRLNRR
jgi:hypothetical protein